MNNTGNHINRSNYEEFFLLFIDGELTPEQRGALNDFLRLNPDLEKELQVLCQYTLKPDESITFTRKETLLHFTIQDVIIHPGNIEYYFMLYADNELSSTQKAAVEEFVYHHPRYQSDFELIQSARLEPDHRSIFNNKEKLFRFENRSRTIPLYRRWQFAAACVLFLCGCIWLSGEVFIPTIPEAKQTHSGQVKKTIDIKLQPQQTIAIKNEKPAKDTASGDLPAKALNKDKLAGHTGLRVDKEKKTSPDNSGYANKSIDPDNLKTFAITGKLIKPAPGKEINISVPEELKPVQAEYPGEQITRTEFNENPEMIDGQVLLANDQPHHFPIPPFNKKQLLRGIFRKTSRFLDHQSSIRNTEPTGLRIGNIEISLQ